MFEIIRDPNYVNLVVREFLDRSNDSILRLIAEAINELEERLDDLTYKVDNE